MWKKAKNKGLFEHLNLPGKMIATDVKFYERNPHCCLNDDIDYQEACKNIEYLTKHDVVVKSGFDIFHHVNEYEALALRDPQSILTVGFHFCH